MASTDLFLSIFTDFFDPTLPKRQTVLLETLLFIYLYEELYKFYHDTCLSNEEESMLGGFVIRSIIKDLLTSDDYSLEGLAKYTGYPVDVIYDIASGLNSDPALSLSTKIIELHAVARRDFYNSLLSNITLRLQRLYNGA